MVLNFTTKDWRGRDLICAYGVTHVPTQPGIYTRYVHLFKPVASSLLSTWIGWYNGENAHYINPTDLLSKNEGRALTRVSSAGTLKIQFTVSMKDLDQFGIYPFKV